MDHKRRTMGAVAVVIVAVAAQLPSALQVLGGDDIYVRPLSEVVFIRFRGCSESEPMVLEPAR